MNVVTVGEENEHLETGEPRSASFDKFSRDQLKVVLKWLDSKEPIKRLTPMTFGKMVIKLVRTITSVSTGKPIPQAGRDSQ